MATTIIAVDTTIATEGVAAATVATADSTKDPIVLPSSADFGLGSYLPIPKSPDTPDNSMVVH